MKLNQVPLPPKVDSTLALISLVHAGQLVAEFRDTAGKVIARQPLVKFVADEKTGVVEARFPLSLLRSCYELEHEIAVCCIRPENADDDKQDIVVVSIKSQEAKRIITESQLPPAVRSEIRKQVRQTYKRMN